MNIELPLTIWLVVYRWYDEHDVVAGYLDNGKALADARKRNGKRKLGQDEGAYAVEELKVRA